MNRVFLTIVLVVLVIPATASTIFYEGFGTPGELNGQTGGSGWGTPWSAVTANTQVQSPGAALTYSIPGGGTINGGSSALHVTGNNDVQIARSVDAAETGDIYFGFLFRHSAGTIDTNDFLSFWFDNNTTVTAGQSGLPNIGEKGNLGTGAGTADFMTRVSIGAPEVYSTAASTGTDYFIVGRLFKDGSANYNRFSLWVNPSAGDALTPDATSMFAGTTSSFLRLGLRSANQDGSDVIYVDELNAGTTWDDVVTAAVVVSIPEPTTLALAGIGLIALVVSRRNRSRA